MTARTIYTSKKPWVKRFNKLFIRIIPVLFLTLIAPLVYSHSGKPKYHVIIDTDASIDDLRAVTTLLACNDIRVLGIIGSQGTLSAKSAADKVSSLLAYFHHEGIPVGLGRSLDQILPFWSAFAGSVSWGNNEFIEPASYQEAVSLMTEITKSYPQKITLIALGALTNLADWLRNNPGKAQMVERIIWYNEIDFKNGFNYQTDPDSYKFIHSLPIPLQVVSNDRSNLVCDQAFIQKLDSAGSIYANHLADIHKQITESNPGKQIHLELGDDLVPLFLTCPIVFTSRDDQHPAVFTLEKNIPVSYVADLISTVLNSSVKPNNRVFTDFPVNPDLYKKNVSDFLPRVIRDFGLSEWKSVVLTNEIHGHTGIYSIIGVKMGVRALEYFNVGVNNLEVVSYAGSEPPLSCLNDGIQISTGATIGQGLIKVDKTVLPNPAVIFVFNSKKIRIELKKEIAERIEADISKGVQQFGMSDKYWAYVEELAYQYWQELDRHFIFNFSF
ncbi:MAG: nucleoside hydrolase [Bacteroidales bacterium]